MRCVCIFPSHLQHLIGEDWRGIEDFVVLNVEQLETFVWVSCVNWEGESIRDFVRCQMFLCCVSYLCQCDKGMEDKENV